jgi:hypothetical protein
MIIIITIIIIPDGTTTSVAKTNTFFKAMGCTKTSGKIVKIAQLIEFYTTLSLTMESDKVRCAHLSA